MKKSVVASTSTRLINRLPHQPPVPASLQQADQQDESGSEEQSDSETEEGKELSPVREKTPDTNVKLHQPLRCGRYGQDLISHKQRAADRAQSQQSQPDAGGKVNPALVASRQSTSAAPMVAQTKAPNPKALMPQAKVLPAPVPSVLPPPALGSSSDRAGASGPAPAVRAQADLAGPTSRAAPAGPAPASVDELLTGPVPRNSVMTASMAGAAAAMAESAAAMAGSAAADREAVKAALGHHYRQYRAKKAAAEKRAKAAGDLAGNSEYTMPVNTAPDAVMMTDQHSVTGLESGQLDIQQKPKAGPDAALDRDDIPLRVKYGSSSDGSSSQAASARSQDTATTSCSGQQLSQQQHAQSQSQHAKQQHQQQLPLHQQAGKSALWANQHHTMHAPSRIHYRNSSAAHVQKMNAHRAQQDSWQHQQPQRLVTEPEVAPEDVELHLAGAAAGHKEDVRRSNDKLDMLLQSTVKRTQQAASGKENKVNAL